MYWSTKARGELAVHFARTSGCGWPSFVGRSRYSGGFLGSGDHAAAVASVARAKKDRLAESSGFFTASRALSTSGFGADRGDRQQGLMMQGVPNTSECFMPMRVAP